MFKKIYHKLPIKFREWFSTLVWNFFAHIKRFYNPIFPEVYIFKGLEKNISLPLSFAFVGSLSQTQEYWSQTVLASGYQRQILGRCFWTLIIPLLRKNNIDCNFFIIECNTLTHSYFSQKPGFHIPRWFIAEIDITLPIKKLLGNERSEIERKIRKHQLTYAITKDSKDLDDFYHNMYLPHIQGRYKNTALLSSHQKLLEILYKGELILIKKGENTIAGGLIEYGKENVFLRMIGIRDGNLEFVHWGAIGAIYYFIIIEVKKKGYKKLTIGGTRPLLSDGLTKFKKSIKAYVKPNAPNARIWLKLLKDSPGLQSFLINNPFIFYTKNEKPHRAVFMQAKENCSKEELKEALHISEIEGIEETNLFIFSKIQNPANYAGILPDSSYTVQSADELL